MLKLEEHSYVNICIWFSCVGMLRVYTGIQKNSKMAKSDRKMNIKIYSYEKLTYLLKLKTNQYCVEIEILYVYVCVGAYVCMYVYVCLLSL